LSEGTSASNEIFGKLPKAQKKHWRQRQKNPGNVFPHITQVIPGHTLIERSSFTL